ncbi:MAG: filamentous hemagglutinin N-terminal domain-containing protein, partial [Phycisphaerales bacterium]
MRLLTKSLRRHHYRWGAACFLTYLVFFNTSLRVARAGPEGAQVVNGEVSIQQSAYNTTIKASNKAIVNYSSFDIAQPETVQFIQPSSSASVLNRILSANPTNINGTLLANGRVFFVNPAGVYIGDAARINVNQLVASALNISDSDFINGRHNFVGGNGSVINSGDISAEEVYLIGKQVTNSGNISCPAGYVVMAAGDRVFLGEPGSNIVLEIDASSLTESADAMGTGVGVLNEGTVDAAGGIIALAAAGDIYSQAISNVGSLSTSVEAGEAGEISLSAAGGEVTNAGTIEASGSEGGQVTMEGARVGQFGMVHADGAVGNGGNVDLTASDVVALSSDSLTTANAGVNGNGGEVIVYSPDTALFWPDATIEAKGGTESGDGGFVEVSGKEHVEIYGSIDASAPHGSAGTFLLDPTDIFIVNTYNGMDDLYDPTAGDPRLFEGVSAENEITASDIQTLLNSGTSVDLDTSRDDGGGPYAGAGDITQNSDAPISFTGAAGAATLSLNAENDIILNGGITAAGDTLGVTLNATGNVEINAGIGTNGGTFTSSGVNFDNTGGVITTAGGDVGIQNTGDVTIGAAINAGAGDVDIDGGAGVATSIGGSGTITSSGTITFDASGSIGVVATAINTAGTGTISASSTGSDIYIDNTGDVTDLRLVADSGTIAFTNVGSIDTGADITANSISLTSSGTMTIDQAVTADSGAVTLSGASVDIDEDVDATGNVDIDATGSVDVDNGRIIAGGTDTALTIDGAGITLNAGGSGTETVTNTGTGTITITDSGDTTLGNDSVSIDSGTLTINSATINAQNAGSADEIKADGDVSLTAAEIGGGTIIDIGGVDNHDGTLTINSNGDGNVDIRVDDDQFDAVDITIAGVTDDTFDIIWGVGPDKIDMETDSIALTLTVTEVDTSNFGTDVDITQEDGDVLVSTVDTDTGNFTLKSTTGSIDDATTDTTTDITAGTVDLDATTGIGATEALELDVTNLEADTDAGGITLTEASGLASADVTTTGAGSHINVTTGNGGTTWTDVDTSGAGSNIALTSGTGTTTLTDVDTVDGTITVSAGGAIVATAVDTGSNNDIGISTSSGNITVGAINAGTGTATLSTSSGAIDDATTDTTTDITAGTVDLDATTGIGATEALELDVTNL